MKSKSKEEFLKLFEAVLKEAKDRGYISKWENICTCCPDDIPDECDRKPDGSCDKDCLYYHTTILVENVIEINEMF